MPETDEKLHALERRVEQFEKLSARMLHIVKRSEAAVSQACKVLERHDHEVGCLRARAIEVINAAGEPMVTIGATDVGGSFLLRNGSGEQAAAIGVDETGSGVLAVHDPNSLALAGLQLRDGRGELMTMGADGRTCCVGPGRSTPKD